MNNNFILFVTWAHSGDSLKLHSAEIFEMFFIVMRS